MARLSLYVERERGARFEQGLGAMKTILLAATLILAAATAPASAADDACLMHRDVDGWGAHGDHAMVVNDKFGR